MACFRRIRDALLAATVLVPVAGARAADVTPADAQALQTQLQSWLSAFVGPKVPLPTTMFKIMPQGDHFSLVINIAGPLPDNVGTLTSPPITASLKPLGNGRWAIDDYKIPSPLRVDISNPGNGPDAFKSWAIKVADQTMKGVLDTTNATTSNFDQVMRDYTSVTQTARGQQITHMNSYTGHTTLQPTGSGGRVNMLSDGKGEGLDTSSALPDGTPFKLSIGTFSGTAHLDRASFDQIGTMIRTLIDVGEASSAGGQGSSSGIAPAQRPAMHKLLASFAAFSTNFTEDYSLQNLAVDIGGHGGTLSKFNLGLGVGAPDGKLSVSLAIGLDGLQSPEIPPGTIHDYVPRHFSIKPRISGLASADVYALLDRAIDSASANDPELEQMAMELLEKGPLSIGIDELQLDMGPASLRGTGEVQISGPDEVVGQAKIRINGFDKLIADSNAKPELKQAGPVLIFLKGIGRPEGNAVVWDVTFEDKKLLVNGTDLSQMMPK